MKTLGEILKGLAKRNDFYKRLLVLSVRERWEEIVGKEVATRSRVSDFSGGVLYVLTDDPLWHEELSLMSRRIAEKINRIFGESLVKRLVIRRSRGWRSTTHRA